MCYIESTPHAYGLALQVQKEFLLTPQLTKALKNKRGELKLCNIASLLKQKSFMSRLTTKSRRGPAQYKPPAMPNPLGQLPDQIKQQDIQASPLLRLCAMFLATSAMHPLPCRGAQSSLLIKQTLKGVLITHTFGYCLAIPVPVATENEISGAVDVATDDPAEP